MNEEYTYPHKQRVTDALRTKILADNAASKCGHCGMWHTGPCPRIKSIEYHPNGTIKKVEYKDETNPLKDYQDSRMFIDNTPVIPR